MKAGGWEGPHAWGRGGRDKAKAPSPARPQDSVGHVLRRLWKPRALPWDAESAAERSQPQRRGSSFPDRPQPGALPVLSPLPHRHKAEAAAGWGRSRSPFLARRLPPSLPASLPPRPDTCGPARPRPGPAPRRREQWRRRAEARGVRRQRGMDPPAKEGSLLVQHSHKFGTKVALRGAGGGTRTGTGTGRRDGLGLGPGLGRFEPGGLSSSLPGRRAVSLPLLGPGPPSPLLAAAPVGRAAGPRAPPGDWGSGAGAVSAGGPGRDGAPGRGVGAGVGVGPVRRSIPGTLAGGRLFVPARRCPVPGPV